MDMRWPTASAAMQVASAALQAVSPLVAGATWPDTLVLMPPFPACLGRKGHVMHTHLLTSMHAGEAHGWRNRPQLR